MSTEIARVGNLNPDHLVSKVKPLMLAKSEPPFTLGELKVLDTYLSRINPKDPEHRRVRFYLKEYVDLVGLKQIKPELMQKHIDNLYDKKVEIYDESRPNRKDSIHLFERRTLDQDEKEQWWVELTCTESARELFFSLENLQYFKYYLANVISLTSMYSYRMYMYVMTQSFRGSWTVGVDELREILDCDAQRYQEFKFFNSEVLKKSVAEVNEKTDAIFECTTVKVGRKISGIKFEMKPAVIEMAPTEGDGEGEERPAPDINDPLALCASALPSDFTRAEVELLRNFAMKHVPFDGTVTTFEEKELWLHDYLYEKVLLMKAQRKPVAKDKRMGFLRRAVEENWK